MDRFTHEDRIIILLLAIWGFILYDGVRDIYMFIAGSIIWSIALYEGFITVKYCHNLKETVFSYLVGFLGEFSVYEMLEYNFRCIEYIFGFIVFLVVAIIINIKSFRYVGKC